jgi:hypothetical protein
MSSRNPDEPTFQEFCRDMRIAIKNLPYAKECITIGREQEVIAIAGKREIMHGRIRCKEGPVMLEVWLVRDQTSKKLTRLK